MDHAAELRESRVAPRLARRQPIEKGPQTFLDDGMTATTQRQLRHMTHFTAFFRQFEATTTTNNA